MLNLDEKLSERQRQATYGVGFLGIGVAILAQVFGWASAADVDHVVDIVSAIGAFLGLGATGLARDVLKEQKTKGAVIGNVDLPVKEVPIEIPVPIELSPLEHITAAVEAASAIERGVKDGVNKITEITGGLINIPAVMAMTPDLPGPLDEMIRGASERFRKP